MLTSGATFGYPVQEIEARTGLDVPRCVIRAFFITFTLVRG
jgi:hypothetical protein